MATPAATSLSNRVPGHLMHKNRLQEYTQKASFPLPIYQTINEGSSNLPRFRSTVLVHGEQFTSSNTFLHRKEAEQDVARIALHHLLNNTKEEGGPLISENQDTVFCKSIINEYAVKMQLEKPIYNTVQSEGSLPVFASSLVFNGVTYTGETGKTKKEAEQLAARAAILSLTANSGSATIISEMVKSKVKLYATLHKLEDSQNIRNSSLSVDLPISAIPQAASVVRQSLDSGPSSGNKRKRQTRKFELKPRVYEDWMNPHVAKMMKKMDFMPGKGLGKNGEGVPSFPDMKGQTTRNGLGYQTNEACQVKESEQT